MKVNNELEPILFRTFFNDADNLDDYTTSYIAYLGSLSGNYPQYDITLFDKVKIDSGTMLIFKLTLFPIYQQAIDYSSTQAIKQPKVVNNKSIKKTIKKLKQASNNHTELVDSGNNLTQGYELATQKQLNYIAYLENLNGIEYKDTSKMTKREAGNYIAQLRDSFLADNPNDQDKINTNKHNKIKLGQQLENKNTSNLINGDEIDF